MPASAPMIAAWDDLASNAAEPNVFNESWYLLPALQLFGQKTGVRIFTLWHGVPQRSKLAGLMPVVQHTSYAGLPIAHYQNWLHPNAFLGAPLVRRGYEAAFWRAILNEIDKQPGNALFFHVNAVNTQGPLQHALGTVCKQDSRQIALVNSKSRAFLQSDMPAQHYYETSVRAKKRKELRRLHNRLSELGDIQFARLDGTQNLDVWTLEFLALERRGWKGANGSALDCQDDTRALFTAALQGAAAQGKLELLELRLNGAPIAMLVNFISAPGSFSYKTAFDEDYARFSPGVLLQINNLDLLERSDIHWCDSCAAQGHPMIDSIWRERRQIGRYSVAIGGAGRRMLFGFILKAELAKMKWRNHSNQNAGGEIQGAEE